MDHLLIKKCTGAHSYKIWVWVTSNLKLRTFEANVRTNETTLINSYVMLTQLVKQLPVKSSTPGRSVFRKIRLRVTVIQSDSQDSHSGLLIY